MNQFTKHLLVGLALVGAVGCEQGGFNADRSQGNENMELQSYNGLASMALSSVSGWSYDSVAMRQFNLEFTANPNQNAADIVIGLSQDEPNGYTDMATIVRFNPSGTIDVRNGSNYSAMRNVPYTAGEYYHFQMSVNLSKHTYSVTVTPAGGSETVLALNYSFRSEQASGCSAD